MGLGRYGGGPDRVVGVLPMRAALAGTTGNAVLMGVAEVGTPIGWVLLPGLAVVPAEQVYTSLGPGRVRYASGTFTADLEVDPEGFVVRYPGLAERVDPR